MYTLQFVDVLSEINVKMYKQYVLHTLYTQDIHW